jgi:hypothetical protein
MTTKVKYIPFEKLPAIPLHRILRQYARAKGMPCLTVQQIKIVAKCYEQEAITRN